MEILRLLEPIGATRAKIGGSGADVGQLKPFGTACMGLNVDGRLYFNTHHTWADTVDKVNPKELSDCAIFHDKACSRPPDPTNNMFI